MCVCVGVYGAGGPGSDIPLMNDSNRPKILLPFRVPSLKRLDNSSNACVFLLFHT